MSILTDSERSYLFDSMTDLLKEYDYDYNDHAIYSIIDTWAERKSDLITAFKKHPNYLPGQFCIAFTSNYEREIDFTQINSFVDWMFRTCAPECRDQLPEKILAELNSSFWPLNTPSCATEVFNRLATDWGGRTVCDDMANYVNEKMPDIHAHSGEKTSRLVNRICTYLNYNKHPDYNKEFAKFADALSPITIKRHTVLSLNPLDYLTMSFGNSWASCHTIDKENKRKMPNSYEGQYSSGTISYMLDPSSMVFYTVDASYDGNEYWTQPKINRQMYHYQHEKLIQGRLYPQANDSHSETYSPYRAIVQEIISSVFDFPNLWMLKKGTKHIGEVVHSYGTHYRDYYNFNTCTLSTRKENTDKNAVIIGALPICIECGNEHHAENNINCCVADASEDGCYCECCGEWIYDDDITWIDGYAYCSNCTFYCECCDEYYCTDDDRVYIESIGNYVCSRCAEEYYRRCDHCRDHYDKDDLVYVASSNKYVCPDCLEEYYEKCADCGEYHLKSNMTKLDDDKLYCKTCAEAAN